MNYVKLFYSVSILISYEEETKPDEISDELLRLIEEHGLEENFAFEIKTGEDNAEPNSEAEDNAVFVKSRRGKKMLQFNNHTYRKAYDTKNGSRWACSVEKTCPAFVYLNDQDEIIMANQDHNHEPPVVETVDTDQTDAAVVITSRKGKEMLLFRQYTYRKQYEKVDKCRWVCSTLKNCHACVFTDRNNYITSAFEEHCHNPPKYYLKPTHVLQALREPLILETD